MPSTTKTNPDLPSGPLAHDGDEPDPDLAVTASQPALEPTLVSAQKEPSPDQKKPSPQPSPYSADRTLEISKVAGIPVVWADEASPFTGPQVKALLEENERLRAANPEPARILELEAALAGQMQNVTTLTQRLAETDERLTENVKELLAHREYVKDKAQTKTFERLMERAKELGALHLTFSVDLGAYFPFPSTKKSWNCMAAKEEDFEPGAHLASAEGRSGEEALREVVLRLEDRKP